MTKLYNLKINIPEENHIWIWDTQSNRKTERKWEIRYVIVSYLYIKRKYTERSPFSLKMILRKCTPSFNNINIIIIVHIVDVLISIRLSSHHHHPSSPLHHHHQNGINKTYLQYYRRRHHRIYREREQQNYTMSDVMVLNYISWINIYILCMNIAY